MNFNDVAIASVKESDYSIRFWHLREDDAIIIMKNYNLNKKVDHYQKHRAIILNTAKEYYKNNQQRLKKQAMNKNRELSKEEKKKKKRKWKKYIYKNMSEQNKQRLREHPKNYRRTKNKNKNFLSFSVYMV